MIPIKSFQIEAFLILYKRDQGLQMEGCCTAPKEWEEESSNVYQGGDKKKIVPICLLSNSR